MVVGAVVLPLTAVAPVRMLTMEPVGMTGRIGLGRSMQSLVADFGSERAFQGAATLALGVPDEYGMAGVRCAASIVQDEP